MWPGASARARSCWPRKPARACSRSPTERLGKNRHGPRRRPLRCCLAHRLAALERQSAGSHRPQPILSHTLRGWEKSGTAQVDGLIGAVWPSAWRRWSGGPRRGGRSPSGTVWRRAPERVPSHAHNILPPSAAAPSAASAAPCPRPGTAAASIGPPVTASHLLGSLAKEFAVDVDALARFVALVDEGFLPPFLARFRSAECGGMNEILMRRILRRRHELEDLERRRASILRLLEARGDVPEKVFEQVRRTWDRFELEDLFLPFRRAEPEVQKALERGLGALADLLVAPMPRAHGSADGQADGQADGAADGEAADGAAAEAPAADAPAAETTATETAAKAEAAPVAAPAETNPAEAAAEDSSAADAPSAEELDAAIAEHEATDGSSGDEEGEEEHEERPAPTLEASIQGVDSEGDHAGVDIVVTPELVRVCRDFVRPDHGVHTEEEALAGAMRILSDRLGRHTALRGQLRRALRKFGVLSVRAAGGDESKAGRHKGLLKLSQPLPQIQGHKLLQVRQAQRDRSIATHITLDAERAMPKVLAALGKHTRPEFQGVLVAVARRAFERRLMPMLEADVRLELKERGDEEALRFLSQHLRQLLMTPTLGPKPVAGIEVTPKGDMVLAVLDAHGVPLVPPAPIAAAELDETAFAEKLSELLRPHGIAWIAMGASRVARPAVRRLRAAIATLQADASVLLVNEAGLSNYANSELARRELPDMTAPARQAISLARRLLDPLSEFLKVDPRHLGLGFEQGLVSKANLRRLFDETLQSAVAHVGVDLTRASVESLRHVPGLDLEKAKALVALRDAGGLSTRAALKTMGLLDEVPWTNAASFLRIPSSSEALDATSLHPEEYEVVERVIAATGQPRDAVIGRFGALRGLNPKDFGVDDPAWRDYTQQLGQPGRDPRPRLFAPTLLPQDTNLETLAKDTVVEGIVSNVANFGAFVDIGLEREGLVHISELAQRYVRDAREAVSVGQVVRARVLDTSGPRIALSFKNLPDRQNRAGGRRAGGEGGEGGERPPRGERPDRKRGGGEHREGRRRDLGRDDQWPEPQRMVRAANSRRDGMPTSTGLRDMGGSGKPPRSGGGQGGGSGGGSGGRGGARGGDRPGGGGGRGGARGGRPGDGGGNFGRGPRDDGDWKSDKPTQTPAGHNPFANFFKKDEKK
ncbi:MAG: S1 RNA-binding domain-containing protein [Planctomycetaceae bacterium]|nr:S1 RNA-binding domain-containing protein [Planctomycetaceae bacterium]